MLSSEEVPRPIRDPIPSMISFPFICASWVRGMKAISLMASKRVYLADLPMQKCKLPKTTAMVKWGRTGEQTDFPKIDHYKESKGDCHHENGGNDRRATPAAGLQKIRS